MISLHDQLGNRIDLNAHPKRIISLVPSITETLLDLGLKDRMSGRTRFCIHPQGIVKSIPKYGGTKTPHIDEIIAANPDLIFANKEENKLSDIEKLKNICPVYVSDIKNLEDLKDFFIDLESLIGPSSLLTDCIKNCSPPTITPHSKALYLIWEKPIMAAGGDTFIHTMMEILGYNNLLYNMPRYPQLEMEQIKELNPDALLLSSEPFPFKETHINKYKTALPNTQIILVDGEKFSWYGTRTIKVLNALRK